MISYKYSFHISLNHFIVSAPQLTINLISFCFTLCCDEDEMLQAPRNSSSVALYQIGGVCPDYLLLNIDSQL